MLGTRDDAAKRLGHVGGLDRVGHGRFSPSTNETRMSPGAAVGSPSAELDDPYVCRPESLAKLRRAGGRTSAPRASTPWVEARANLDQAVQNPALRPSVRLISAQLHGRQQGHPGKCGGDLLIPSARGVLIAQRSGRCRVPEPGHEFSHRRARLCGHHGSRVSQVMQSKVRAPGFGSCRHIRIGQLGVREVPRGRTRSCK
jgi:hypothetical protein